MTDLSSLIPLALSIVATGDSTDFTVPALAAGIGVGAIAVALLARRRGKDDGGSAEVPPTQGRKSKHLK